MELFLPGEQGTYDERRVQKLDLVERSPDDVVRTFRRYLSFERVRSGEAIEGARADYQSISKRMTAAREIPKAWSELVSEPDELLIDLLAEKAETLCGYRPASEDVEAFLINELAVRTPNRPSPSSPMPAPRVTSAPKPISQSGVTFSLLGETKHAANAIDALMDILRTLSQRKADFIETVAPLVRGRTRNHLARSRTDVYPRKPELSEYTVELVPGWWLGTNISNRDKMKIIRKACEVAGLRIGKDLNITLPNA